MNISSSTALMPIDIQAGFADQEHWGKRGNPGFEEAAAALLRAARAAGRRIYHVQHVSTSAASPLHPGKPGVELLPFARPQPGEPLIQKSVHSAFVGSDLEAQLRRDGIDHLVLFGIATDHCVSTNTRHAQNLGFAVTVVDDASLTFDRIGRDGTRYPAELVQAITLASLDRWFGRVVLSRDLIG